MEKTDLLTTNAARIQGPQKAPQQHIFNAKLMPKLNRKYSSSKKPDLHWGFQNDWQFIRQRSKKVKVYGQSLYITCS